MATRPKPGSVEERQAPDLLAADGKRIRGRIPYGVESRDMDGWREVIEPGALSRTVFDDLVVTVDHVGVPLGRFPGTLELEDRDDGLHWSVEPPASRADVTESCKTEYCSHCILFVVRRRRPEGCYAGPRAAVRCTIGTRGG